MPWKKYVNDCCEPTRPYKKLEFLLRSLAQMPSLLFVSRIDEAAVRNTPDVDILIRREDFERIKMALDEAGFVYGSSKNVEFFLDGPDAKIRDAIHILFADEKVRDRYLAPTPDVSESDHAGQFPIVDLESLIRMSLPRIVTKIALICAT